MILELNIRHLNPPKHFLALTSIIASVQKNPDAYSAEYPPFYNIRSDIRQPYAVPYLCRIQVRRYIKKKAGLADKPDYLVHFYKSLTIIIAVPVAWRLVQYRNPPRMALPASLTRMCEARSDRWTTPCEYQPVNRYIQYNRFKPWMKFFQKKRSPKAKKIYRVYSGLSRIHIICRIRLLICTSGQ